MYVDGRFTAPQKNKARLFKKTQPSYLNKKSYTIPNSVASGLIAGEAIMGMVWLVWRSGT